MVDLDGQYAVNSRDLMVDVVDCFTAESGANYTRAWQITTPQGRQLTTFVMDLASKLDPNVCR